jgi:hypothetical protein
MSTSPCRLDMPARVVQQVKCIGNLPKNMVL